MVCRFAPAPAFDLVVTAWRLDSDSVAAWDPLSSTGGPLGNAGGGFGARWTPINSFGFGADDAAMNWILLSLVSAVLLGCYDISKKKAASANAVPAVLLISTSIGAALWLPLVVWYFVDPTSQPVAWLAIEPLDVRGHWLVVAKSVLVASSWTFALFALKHLPLSIAAPIRSTSPLWTILIATVVLGERPTTVQWAGIVIVLFSFWMFSVVGRREGIHFIRDRWVACMMLATVTGAVSSIYDKYLLQTVGIPVATLQAWFTLYLVPAMVPCFLWWFRMDRRRMPLQWRRSICLISPLLLAADLVYFNAVADSDALISVISTLRRCSVVVAFIYGIGALKERQVAAKAMCIAGILLGVIVLTCFG